MEIYNIYMIMIHNGRTTHYQGQLNGFQTRREMGLLEGEVINGTLWKIDGHSSNNSDKRELRFLQTNKRPDLPDLVVSLSKKTKGFAGLYSGRWTAASGKVSPESHWDLEEDPKRYTGAGNESGGMIMEVDLVQNI